jgi:hypothetical protein
MNWQLEDIAKTLIKLLKEINIEIENYSENTSLIEAFYEYAPAEFDHHISFSCKNLKYDFQLHTSDKYFNKNDFELCFSFEDKKLGKLKKVTTLAFDNCWNEIALIIEWIKENV